MKAQSDRFLVFGLFGNPVRHSFSPLMHHAAYTRMGLAARYTSFRVNDLKEAVESIRKAAMRGVSVTIPFKSEVINLLDDMDPSALAIGAVNTIANENGNLKGYNTDWTGFITDLKPWLDLKGKSMAVIGAGGMARAVLFGIQKEGGTPMIFNRNVRKAESLAEEFHCQGYPLSACGHIQADVLINTTPAGMYPDVQHSPLDKKALAVFPWVVDVVYNPLRTQLLRDAESAGCSIRSGLGIFVHQGAEQIKIWTGLEPPRALMRQVVFEALEIRRED